MSLTRQDVRLKGYMKVGADVLGFAGTADVITTGITDAVRFGNSAQSLNKYMGRKIFIPEPGVTNYLTDRIKPAGKISGSTLLHTAPSVYAADTIEKQRNYEVLPPDIWPDDLNDCARRGLRRVVFETWAPLYAFPDGDFSAADTDDWIAGSLAPISISKSLDLAHNQTGFRSLLVTNQHVGDYAKNATSLLVMPGERYYLAALPIIMQGGPAIFRVYDATHGTELFREGSSVALTATSRASQHLSGVFKVPPGCYLLDVRLEATAINSIVAWDALPGHGMHWRRFSTPDWLDEAWKLINVNQAQYGQEFILGVANALSRSYYPWERPQDYDHEATNPESNPSNLQVNRGLNGPPGTPEEGLPEADVWYHGKRAYSDISTFEDDTTPTDAPEDYVMAAYLNEVYVHLDSIRDGNTYKDDIASTQAVLDAQREAHRPTMGRRAPSDTYIPGGSLRGPRGGW